MTVNIVLAIGIALVTAILSGLGGHLASDKPWQKWIFWIGGLIGLTLISWQTIRNERAQGKLQEQLDTIQRNTEKPPVVTVNPVINTPPAHTHLGYSAMTEYQPSEPLMPLHIGQIPKININVLNFGNTVADADFAGKVYLRPTSVLRAPHSDAMFEEFLNSKPTFAPCGTIPATNPTRGCFHTYFGPELKTQKDVDDIVEGRTALCAVARARWTDESGKYQVDMCQCLARNKGMATLNWGSCQTHNSEAKITQQP